MVFCSKDLNPVKLKFPAMILFFFFKFLFGPRSILWSHWLLLFWTLCVLPHGLQIQSGYLACTLSCLHAVILKVTTGATPAFSTNRGVHCISMYMAWLARLLSHALGFEPPTQWWAAQWCMTKSDALPTELFRRPQPWFFFSSVPCSLRSVRTR